METLIEKYALANALKYGGTASAGNIIGQIIREDPQAKQHIKELQQKATSIVAAVNALSEDEQRARLQQIAPELLEKKEHKEHDLFAFLEIPDDFPVITGFPPEPSKYPHIGHVKALLVNYELAQRYKGKFFMRFDDTNPELAKTEFYEILLENLKWLGVTPDKVDYATDFMHTFYLSAEKLIAADKCFVCDCSAETTNSLRYEGKPCAHRTMPVQETLSRWKALKEGEVLRLKIAPDHQNTTMRDPTIFRVNKTPHARTGTKYSVWPTYDFETCLMDALQGITHRLRSKEFELRTELHHYIQTSLGYGTTVYYEFARFNLEGVESSGRIIREKVQSGQLVGWDDPALTTIVALRRRGFTPQAIRSFVLSTGITKNEATLTWADLELHNKRVLNDTAKRLFFLENPLAITIQNAPAREVHLGYFPQAPSKERHFSTGQDFLIASDDYYALEPGKLYRLMDCVNFTRSGDSFTYHSDDIQTYRESGSRILHFLPKNHPSVHVSVLMPDKTVKTGLGEQNCAKLSIGDHVQFERFGFCRLDSIKDGVFHFWFTHK